MPSRTTGIHSFSIEQQRLPPTAGINPSEQNKVIGSIIKLDGRASVSPDESELSYTWTFVETPLGSLVTELTPINDEGSVVTFVPDKTGEYVIGLVASTPYRDSEQVTATVEVQAILAPLSTRTTPDGSLMFQLMSGFWRYVEDRNVFSTLWSAYMQLSASDLLRVFQVDYGKSIRTIQNLFRRRWIGYSPRLDISGMSITGTFGGGQSGAGAFTASGAAAGRGIILDQQELILLDGAPTLDGVGGTLSVFTGNNVGSYLINRINAAGTGYVVSSTTPFSSSDRLASGTDAITLSGSSEVTVADSGVDFSAVGVQPGDMLQIQDGPDAGYYPISQVGTAGGLVNEYTLQIESELRSSGSGRSYSIFKRVRIYAIRQAVPTTNTVYIPQGEADLDLFSAGTLRGRGVPLGPYELVVESRHIFPSLVGFRIRVGSGADGGRSLTITGVNDSGTGYTVSSRLTSFGPSVTVSYEVPGAADIADRMLILGDRAYRIIDAKLSDNVLVEDGGDDPVWVVTLDQAAAPAGLTNQSWRISSTLYTEDVEDFEDLGVVSGDLLMLRISRTDGGQSSLLPCYVLGAEGGRIAFDFGTSEPIVAANSQVSAGDQVRLSQELQIPRVRLDPTTGTPLVTSLAAQVEAEVTSLSFASTYHNLPITPDTNINIGPYVVRVSPAYIIRNSRIPVDDTLLSVPSLFEYIDEPQVGMDAQGQIILAGADAQVYPLDRLPYEMIENRDYSINAQDTFSGTNLETVADSDILRFPLGDLIDRDLRVGDVIDVLSGFDQGRYVVQAVLDSERVRAVTELGATPDNNATGLRFIVRFRTAGNFIRFVDGMFTPTQPAPERLWAQTSLYDNSDYIEANFGALVGVTKDQLDEYGTTQISYKGAVQALMYAWTNGPTLRNVLIGCNILVGEAVTEVRGRILQIDDDYDTVNNQGRVLIEDVDDADQGLGLIRIYFYASPDEAGLGEFSGLATNEQTGNPYAVGDLVEAFTPLTNTVLVDDYISDPDWWRRTGATPADELRKFHTWQVQVNVQEVDSRDVPLIFDFCMGIRPVYTEPVISLVLYLFDDVTVEESPSLGWTAFFSDDTAHSLESTKMVDSYNGHSLPNRITDFGSFSTRTLFEGVDLVTSAGSGTVTSDRGGFVGVLDQTPLDHALSEPVGLLQGVNPDFTGDILYRGTPLVRVGDILFIREGSNRGRYRITAVTDTTLTIEELAGWPPQSLPVSEISAASGQVFQIQRQDQPELVSGTATISYYDSMSDVTVIEDLTGSFRWNGCAVGDTLLISTAGADYGTHEILQVGRIDGFGDVVDLDTTLTVAGQLTTPSMAYTVRRERLRPNPLIVRTDGSSTAASQELSSIAGGLLLEELRYDDEIVMGNGTDATQVFRLIAVIDDTTLLLNRPLTATEAGLEFTVRRPGRFEEAADHDTDWMMESVAPEDAVTLTFTPDADWSVNGATATLSGVDLELVPGFAPIVYPGDTLELDSLGSFIVASVVVDVLTLTEDTGVGSPTNYTGRVIRSRR